MVQCTTLDGAPSVADGRISRGALKYEWLYLNDYQEVRELKLGLREYMKFYNEQRLHSSLRYRTPQEVHFTTPGSMAV